MHLLWQTWNELATVEGIRQPGFPARFKQLGEFVSGLFDLAKNFLVGFLCVKHYDFGVFVLRTDLIVCVDERAGDLVGEIASRRSRTRAWSEEQCDVEALPIRAIDDRSRFNESKEELSAMNAPVSVSVQRGIPLGLGRLQRV